MRRRLSPAAALIVGGVAWAAALAATALAATAVAGAMLAGGLMVGALVVGAGPAAAQGNPMLGSWTVVDTTTGIHEKLTVTDRSLTFGALKPPIPYRLERRGEALAVYLAGAKEPVSFTVLDQSHALLSLPGGPTLSLRRQAPPPRAPGVQREPRHSVIDSAADALLRGYARPH